MEQKKKNTVTFNLPPTGNKTMTNPFMSKIMCIEYIFFLITFSLYVQNKELVKVSKSENNTLELEESYSTIWLVWLY